MLLVWAGNKYYIFHLISRDCVQLWAVVLHIVFFQNLYYGSLSSLSPIFNKITILESTIVM